MTNLPDWLLQTVTDKLHADTESVAEGSALDESVQIFSLTLSETTEQVKTIALLKIGADVDQLDLHMDKEWLQQLTNKISQANHVVCFYSRVVEFLKPLLNDTQELHLLAPSSFSSLTPQPLLVSRSVSELQLPTDARMFSNLALNELPRTGSAGGFSGLPWDGSRIKLDFSSRVYAYTEGLRKVGHNGR